jgi:hypothetical protein
MTKGLVAREVNGVIKIFDVASGNEVLDVAEHQMDYELKVSVVHICTSATPN